MDRRSLLLAAPLGVAALGGAGFWAMLHGMQTGNFDPRGVPSPITGQPVPSFNLPAQPPGQGFSSVELATGKPLLLNFFASWCVPCVAENPTPAGACPLGRADLGDRLQGWRGQSGAVYPAPRQSVSAYRTGCAGPGGD